MPVALTAVPPCEQVSADPPEIGVADLQACQRLDPAALRRFVLRYQRPVFSFLARAVGAGAHVEDLAQEVFLRAHQALPRFDPRGPAQVSTWLLTIARRVAMDARRARRGRLRFAEPPEPVDPGTPETEQRRREIASAFESAAAQLTDEQRDAFVLAQFHGLTMAEIAQVLEIPENTVRTRLFRARERLRVLLASVKEG